MIQISRNRIEKIEEALAAEREKKRKQFAKYIANCKALASRHATAVAAIVLAGQAKIDEPLSHAWARALEHYNIGGNNGRQLDDQIAAARQLRPKIRGSEQESARFADIFRTAPVWLLQFTGMAWDARLLQFQLPDLSQTLSWGSGGYEAARRWPLLPSGLLEAGDPIPPNDPRWIWIALFCQITVPIPDKNTLSQADEQNRSDDDHPILESLSLLLELENNPERELSRYEKRRLRKLERIFGAIAAP
jgi:hypothetical protein